MSEEEELDRVTKEHPWKKFAGMFADDPDWEEFQKEIQKYREEIDAEAIDEE